MEAMAEMSGAVTEDEIQRLHGLVMTVRNKPSPYRTVQNVIREAATGALVYLPPEAPDVPALMKDLVLWINVEPGMNGGELVMGEAGDDWRG